MISAVKNTGYWTAGFVFLGLLIFTLTRFGGYYIQLLTAVTIGGCGIIFFMAGIRWSFHMVLFSLPLSMNIPAGSGSQVMFPSELLVAAFGISVVLYWLRYGSVFYEWLTHPVTIALTGYLFFVFISLLFSEMMEVSVKSVIIKIIYIIAFYGGAFICFRQHREYGSAVGYYLLPLIAVVIVTLVKHADFDFSKDVAGYVTKPFYQDHTIYSAAMAFIMPLAALKAWNARGGWKLLYLTATLILIAALVIAGSRAAWLSAGLSLIFYVLLVFRFPSKGFLVLLLLAVSLILTRSEDFVWVLKANRFDSNARNAGIEEQTKSVINITNDQSNAERINRWKCAWRMFREKPLTGFGPGTYQFVYFPFQRENELTRISVTSPYNIADGRGGTAHNEFLLVLAESGAGAALFFSAMVMMVIFTGIKYCYLPGQGIMPFGMLFAFSTYIIHSLFNNFLDTDKTAALFFMAIAYFAAQDHSGNKASGHGC